MKDQENNRYGFVYVLGNYSMPNIYKIGATTRTPSQRCNELSSSTSCPESFSLLIYAEVENPFAVEESLHRKFAKQSVNPYREFFKLCKEETEVLERELIDEAITICHVEWSPFLHIMHHPSDEAERYFIESGYADIFEHDKYSDGI